DDTVVGHCSANLIDQIGWKDWEASVARDRRNVGDLALARLQHRIEPPVAIGDNVLLDLPDRVGDIPNNLDLREVDRVNLGCLGRDMDYLRATHLHEERRFFNNVMADIDDQV